MRIGKRQPFGVLLLVLAGAACGVAGGVLYSKSVKFRSQPSLEISETDVDFGELAPGRSASRTIYFRNVGREHLRIEDVRSSCGCTLAELSDQDLNPGEETRLQISLTAGEHPQSSALITVTTNDPKAQIQFINVKAEKPWGADVSPNLLMFNNLTSNSGDTAQQGFVSMTRDDLFKNNNEITASPESPYFACDVAPEPESFRAVITVRLSNSKLTGDYRSAIRLRDREGLVDRRMAVQVNCQSRLLLPAPEVAISGTTSTFRDSGAEIVLLHRIGDPIEITSVRIDGDTGKYLEARHIGEMSGKNVISIRQSTQGKSTDSRIKGNLLVDVKSGTIAETFSIPLSYSST